MGLVKARKSVKAVSGRAVISTAKLARFLRLEKRRLALAARARDIGKETTSIIEELLPIAKARLGSKREGVIQVGPFLVHLKRGRGSVKWKAEYIAECGSAAATKLQGSQPYVSYLEISRES